MKDKALTKPQQALLEKVKRLKHTTCSEGYKPAQALISRGLVDHRKLPYGQLSLIAKKLVKVEWLRGEHNTRALAINDIQVCGPDDGPFTVMHAYEVKESVLCAAILGKKLDDSSED